MPQTMQSPQFFAADWLVQCPGVGLKLSYQYNPDGTWEHRIASISDVEISVEPGGGICTVGNLTVRIYEDGTGQSLLARWNALHLMEGQEITLHLLLAGDTTPLQIFDGHILEVTIQDAVSELVAIDDSLKTNVLLPKRLLTTADFAQASRGALNRAIPLVYGSGARAQAAPLLFVNTLSRTYVACTRAMNTLGTRYAVYNPATNTYHGRTGDVTLTASAATVVFSLPVQELRFGVETGALRVLRQLGVSQPGYALDGLTTTIATINTATVASNLDGRGFLGIAASFTSAIRGANTMLISAVNHRAGISSPATTTGQFIVRTAASDGTVLRDNLFQSETFRHKLNPRDSTFTLTALQLGPTEILETLLVAQHEGGVGGATAFYALQDLTVQGFLQPQGDDVPLVLLDDWRGQTDADGTLTGITGTLLTTPSDVTGDILLNEIVQPLSQASFQQARAFYLAKGDVFDGGIGAGWGQDRTDARTLLGSLARQARMQLYCDWTGAWTCRPYPDTPEVLAALTQHHVLYAFGAERTPPSQRQSTLRMTLGKLDLVAHRFEVHYGWNPGRSGYDKTLIADETGANTPGVDAATLYTLCANSFKRYGTLQPRVIECSMLADDGTAARLLTHLVQYFWSQRLFIDLEIPLQLALQLDLATYFTLTHPYLPDLDNGGTFEVHRWVHRPGQGRIRLVASKVTAIPFEYFALRDSDDVTWYFWVNIAGGLDRHTAIPSMPPLVAMSVTGGTPIPQALLTTVSDAAGGDMWLYPNTLGELTAFTSPPSGTTVWEISGLGKRTVGLDGQTYRLNAYSWQQWGLEVVTALTPPG